MPLAPATRVGPYEILELLGSGGMGEVYRARDVRLGRLVAIKVLPATALDDAEEHRRLLHEARAASALNHPNIVTVHDIGDEQGAAFVAMELVDGEALSDKLARRALPLAEALKYAIQMADALAVAHAAGIIHRDLKPQNVMVTAQGSVKILDFGIAKSVGPHSGETLTVARTSEGHIVGTVGYMSPEQAEGRSVDARSDIFSFGSVVFEMVSGRPAFRRDTSLATLAAIARDEPTPLSEIITTVPSELERIVSKCLRKDSGRRFQSMPDLRVALEDLRDDLAAGRLDQAPAARASHPRKFSRAAGALLAAALMVGIAIGVIATRGLRIVRENEAAPASLPTALTRLTYDDGYAEGPALSPDGTLVAYASDRSGAGNLDIWVQRGAGGGDPIQLTRDAGDERQPSFSPDGGQIVYRSEAEGGALYTMPALGGQPRLLVEGGIDGRYSPDGKSVAYWSGGEIGFSQRLNSYRTFVVSATGGSPTELQGFTGARFPVWSPDGRFLIIHGTRAEVPAPNSYDWWIVRMDTGEAVATGAAAAFRAAGVEAAAGAVGLLPAPAAWLGDRVVAAAAGSLWSVELGPPPVYSVSNVHRLTFGPGDAGDPTISRDGVIAFVGATSTHNIWALPIDAESTTVRGDLRKVTNVAGHYSRATFSADGRMIAFQSQRGSKWTIMTMDRSTGRITDLAVSARPGGPVISPDGTKVAYLDADGASYVVAIRGGAPRKLCNKCGIGDWTNDGRRIITGVGGDPKLVDVGSGESVALLDAPVNVDRAHPSPDNRWLAFRTIDQERQRVFVAPFRPEAPAKPAEWVAITDEELDVRPCGWAPSGRMLYLVSSRDGFRCLYACPWDPQKGQPRGPVQLVRHIHNIRNLGWGGASVISTGNGNAVMKDQVLLDLATTVSNIWTMRLPVSQ